MKLLLNHNGEDFCVEQSGAVLIAHYRPFVHSSEGEFHFSNWKTLGDKEWEASHPAGLCRVTATSPEKGSALELTLEFQNRSHQSMTLKQLGWESCAPGALVPFAELSGEEIGVFSEGWSMPTPSASHRYGEKDFGSNPDYKRFAYPDVTLHNDQDANIFSSSCMMMLQNRTSRFTLLAGFITSKDAFSFFRAEPGVRGVNRFVAASLMDGVVLDAQESRASETLYLEAGMDAETLAERFAQRWGEAMHARRWSHTPNGWCSWYYYFEHVTEADVVENAQYLGAHHQEYPLEYLQIDDGYQAALGDWLTTQAKFPHGLPFLAETIHANGLKAGLWLAPFMVEERSELCAAHPDYLVHNHQGEIAWVSTWRGCRVAALDGTNPAVQEHFRKLFKTLAEIGFDYVKLDFMVYASAVPDAAYFDPRATRAQALYRGLKAIREGFGEDRFILGCTVPLGPIVGLVNAERISTDITPYWRSENDPLEYKESCSVPHVCRNIINRRYLHQQLFLNDPDVHIARRDNNRLSEDEIHLWTTALYLAGGLTLLTDRFSTLDADRAELSKLLLSESDAFEMLRPLDRFEREYPSLWAARQKKTGKLALGCFNFTEAEVLYQVPETAFPAAGKTFQEFWSGEKVLAENGILSLKVAPHSVKFLLQN